MFFRQQENPDPNNSLVPGMLILYLAFFLWGIFFFVLQGMALNGGNGLHVNVMDRWSKMAIYLSPLGLHKGCPSYRRSLQPSKEKIQHFKKWNLLTVLNFCGSFCAVLDPDPNRIHNNVLLVIFLSLFCSARAGVLTANSWSQTSLWTNTSRIVPAGEIHKEQKSIG
jgi:hypothetical protein